MKKGTIVLVILFLVGLTFTSGCTSNKKTDENATAVSNEAKTNEIKYKDGDYEVQTEKDHEGYYCIATVSIKDNKITNVEWNIYDSVNGIIFDEKYEKIYVGNPTYIQQCRDDLKGAETYGPKLIEVQDIEKVDAISKATWTNIHFKNAVKLALEKAKL